MGSVIVKGMDMPQNCQNCMDANLNIAISLFGAMCPFCEKIFVADINIRKQRHPDCPLIELPPHGRLIDIKSVEDGKFVTVINDYQRWWNGALESVIDNAPTVIEAEGARHEIHHRIK